MNTEGGWDIERRGPNPRVWSSDDGGPQDTLCVLCWGGLRPAGSSGALGGRLVGSVLPPWRL